MDKCELDKKLKKLVEILSAFGDIYEDMRLLRLRLADTIYELENMRSDLEAFGDEINKGNDNEKL